MTDDERESASRPDWWETNQEIRERYSLPDYDAPRFEDGTYTYEVVPQLEKQYDREIRLIGMNALYPEDWEVRVDGERVMDIAYRRDKRGNSVYQMTAEEFCESLRRALEDRPDDTS